VPLRVVNVTWTDCGRWLAFATVGARFGLREDGFEVSGRLRRDHLPVARTAVSSENVAMVGVGEVGRSAVYLRYNNGPRTLSWGTPAWIGDRVW
jgi:hypothetical protein